jgi:hypothetical protein
MYLSLKRFMPHKSDFLYLTWKDLCGKLFSCQFMLDQIYSSKTSPTQSFKRLKNLIKTLMWNLSLESKVNLFQLTIIFGWYFHLLVITVDHDVLNFGLRIELWLHFYLRIDGVCLPFTLQNQFLLFFYECIIVLAHIACHNPNLNFSLHI